MREAPSGDEALARWEPVDVLVTDVVMPGMSGQQLAEHARGRAPELRVVFMSGHTDDIVVRDGARHGDIAFVQKPFTRDSLLRAVEQAVAREPPPAGANGASAGPERARPERPRPRRSGGGWTARRADRRRAGRPARIPDRLSKTLEWGDSSRHDRFPAAGPLESSNGKPGRLAVYQPPGAAGLAPQAPAPPNAGADSARSVAARRR